MLVIGQVVADELGRDVNREVGDRTLKVCDSGLLLCLDGRMGLLNNAGGFCLRLGEDVKADITAKAQAEAAGMIEKAHAAIEADKKAAIAELQGSVADLSVAVASRLIGEDLNDDEHRKIIERYVNEAGSFNAN